MPRESVKTGMRCQREAEDDSNASASLRPLRAAEENERGHGGREDCERERMRDRAMGQQRGISQLQRRPEHIDIRQGSAGSGNEAQTSRRRSPLSPGSDREANGGM